MSARDRAIEIVRAHIGSWSRETILAMLADPGTSGADMRRLVSTIERGIEDDRKALRNERAPS